MKRKKKKFSGVLLTIVVIVIVAFLGLRLVNTCSVCDKTFVGLGYEGNAIDNAVAEEEQILCEDCARLHHALSLIGDKTVDDFKRVLVPGKLIPGEIRFGADS